MTAESAVPDWAMRTVSLDVLKGRPFDIFEPARLTSPLIFASPHSGRDYPRAFLDQVCLEPRILRQSEDFLIDDLFRAAVEAGAPLICARFPRSFIDVNREAYELDPKMFDDPLPTHANVRSVRVAGGLGTLARVVNDGAEIYRGKLSVQEAEDRIGAFYRPFHNALERLIDRAMREFGCSVLIDCHSMPAHSVSDGAQRGRAVPDIVLGDRYGTSCLPALTRTIAQSFQQMGYRVERNLIYAGGFTTENYGRPGLDRQAVQIELNRRLYMDEASLAPNRRYASLRRDVARLIRSLARSVKADLQTPPPARAAE